MAFDIEAAKKDGYSDQEIADYLAKQNNFDAAGARKGGYSDAEIIKHLSSKAPAPKEEPKAAPQEDTSFFGGLRRAGLLPSEKEGEGPSIGSLVQNVFTAPLGGFMKAAADIPVGLAQLAVNALGSDATKDQINEWVKAYNRFGNTSEATRFVGSMALPIGGALKAQSAAGAIGKSALMGGAVASLTPTETTTEAFWGDKAFQAGVGAVLGGLIPAASIGLGKIASILDDVNISRAAKNEAIRKYLVEKAGPDAPEVVQKLRNAGELVSGSKPTVAEAVSDIPSAAGLMAEQGRVAGKTTDFVTREAEQAAARQKALGSIATPRGITQEEMMAAREVATAPAREGALSQANIYGRVAPGLEADIAAREQGAISALQVQGKTATEAAQAGVRYAEGKPGWLSNADRAVEFKQAAIDSGDIKAQRNAEQAFKTMQLKSLKDEGFFPLETSAVKDKISSIASTPGLRAKEGIPEALADISKKLDSFTSDTGIINSADLYAIRQNIGNDIKAALAGRNVTPDEKVIAGISSSVQKSIDEAITKASGSSLWNNYLKNYSKYSQRLDRMKVGQALMDKLGGVGKFDKEQAGAFAQAVSKPSPIIKEATGTTAEKALEDVLTPRELSTVASVVADLKRSKKAAELASKVEKPTGKVGGNLPDVNLLDRTATIVESILRYMRQGDQKKMDLLVADLMLDPQKMADFISAVPKDKMGTVVKGMKLTSSPETVRALEQRFGIAVGQDIRREE